MGFQHVASLDLVPSYLPYFFVPKSLSISIYIYIYIYASFSLKRAEVCHLDLSENG